MIKKYLTPLLSLAFLLPTSSFAITKNVTISFNLENIALTEVEQFNTYLSYNETMEPQTLLTNCTPPSADSVNPLSITCPNVTIDQYPIYLKIAAVVSGEEVASAEKEVVVSMSKVLNFQILTPSAPAPAPEGTVFLWSMEDLPTTTTTSDIGDITITKHLYDGTSSPGVINNGLQQTGVWQTYKFPMTTLPTQKGTYTFWAKHDFSSAANDSQTRYFFRSTKTDQANTIYAWQNFSTTWFYVVDSSGTNHRVFNQSDSWQAGVWYKYEFTWDAATGYIAVKRDGNVVAEKTETPWAQNAPTWGTQEMFIGYSYNIGSFDEFTISQ